MDNIEKEINKEMGKLSEDEVLEMSTSKKKTWKKTPWIESKILAHLAEGKTKKRAAELSGITEQSLYNWIKDDDVFKQRVMNSMGGEVTLRAIDNIADDVLAGNLDSSKWWLTKTKAFDKRYDPKLAENKLDLNPRTGVYEIVEAENLADALLGPDMSDDVDETDLEELLYLQDKDID